jgi:hypothetical protein
MMKSDAGKKWMTKSKSQSRESRRKALPESLGKK